MELFKSKSGEGFTNSKRGSLLELTLKLIYHVSVCSSPLNPGGKNNLRRVHTQGHSMMSNSFFGKRNICFIKSMNGFKSHVANNFLLCE